MAIADPMELEPPSGLTIRHDARRVVPEPPPVRLVAVDDVHLPAETGPSDPMDAFYVGLFAFERRYADADVIVYHAERFRLMFDLEEPPVEHEHLRPIGIEVPRLSVLIERMRDAGVAFDVVKAIVSGQIVIELQDPAGNWLAVTERREVG